MRSDAVDPWIQGPSRTFQPRVSIVIPTYNEAKNLPHVFSRLPDDVHEVIVVDGRSVDGTVAVARMLRPDVRLVRQNRCGKGNALACGFELVTGDIVVMLDADGSADPREIPRYVAALLAGADFAKGTRFAGGGGSDDITPTRAWGNRWLNRAVNVLFGTRYTDLCYGYNAFWTHCLPVLELHAGDRGKVSKLWGDGFEIETIINTRVAKAGLAITEVPSFERRRLHGQTNLNTWRDGARVLRALVVERFNGMGSGHAWRADGQPVGTCVTPARSRQSRTPVPIPSVLPLPRWRWRWRRPGESVRALPISVEAVPPAVLSPRQLPPTRVLRTMRSPSTSHLI